MWPLRLEESFQADCHLPKHPHSSGLHSGVEVSWLDLQLEGWRDVEKTTDSWVEAQSIWWARALQGEGLQDGSEEEEELRSHQALSKADALTWQEGDRLSQPPQAYSGSHLCVLGCGEHACSWHPQPVLARVH
jgi:hypothetical protein